MLMDYIIIALIITLLAIYILLAYNSFIEIDYKVQEAFSITDEYLKKRWELIPDLVEVVKKYAKDEKDTFSEIGELRKSIPNYDYITEIEKIKISEISSRYISKIFVMTEAYPDLINNDDFKNLSNQLSIIEDEIGYLRKYYNKKVRDYNKKVKRFPSNFVALIFGFKLKDVFQTNE